VGSGALRVALLIAGSWIIGGSAAGCDDEFETGAPTGQGAAGGQGGSGGAITCTPGEVIPCYEGPSETQDVGACTTGEGTCNVDGTGVTACLDQVLPAVEDCGTSEDDDCNGQDNDRCAGWSELYPVTEHHEPHGVAVGPDGDIVMGGYARGTVTFGTDTESCVDADTFRQALVAAVDGSGDYLWARCFGSQSANQEVQDVAVAASGAIYAAGYFEAQLGLGVPDQLPPGDSDAFVVSFAGDSTYGPNWALPFGDDVGVQNATAVVAHPSNDAIVGGEFTGTIHFGTTGFDAGTQWADVFVARLAASNGSEVWAKRFGANYGQTRARLAVDPTGDVIVAGYFHGTVDFGGGERSPDSGATFVLKLDGDTGDHVWSVVIDGPEGQHPYAVATDGSRIAVVGTVEGGGGVDLGGTVQATVGAEDAFVVVLDASDGSFQWGHVFGAEFEYQYFNDVAIDADGTVTVVGELTGAVDFGGGVLENPTDTDDTDALVVAFDSAGAHLYSRRFGSADPTRDQDLANLALTSDGGFVAFGETEDSIDFGQGPLDGYGFVLAYFPPQ
jgi:hypothetical protein